MTNIQFLKDRIIIDGHAETKQECETITLLCDNLAKSKDFKTVRYESGYAEFVKVGKANDLKFVSGGLPIIMYFDSHITKVTAVYGYIDSAGHIVKEDEILATWTTSGQSSGVIRQSSLYIQVYCEYGYQLDTAVASGNSETRLDYFNKNSFILYQSGGADTNDQIITISSEQTAVDNSKHIVDLSLFSAWANLSNGEHSITVKAIGGLSYGDSEASNAVTVTKGVSGGYTVNFSNNLGENPSTSGKVEYTLDGSTWNTVLEWSNWDGNQPPLQVTTLNNVSTIKFRLTMAEGEPSTLILTGIVAGSTTKVFEIETNFSTTTVSTDMLTLTSDINVSITNRDTAPGSGYTVSYTNKGAAQAPCKIKINGGDWVIITESSGSFQNVEKIQFYLTLANSYACTVKSTQLGLNLSANSVTTTNEYAIQENVTDIIIGFEPEMTGM